MRVKKIYLALYLIGVLLHGIGLYMDSDIIWGIGSIFILATPILTGGFVEKDSEKPGGQGDDAPVSSETDPIDPK